MRYTRFVLPNPEALMCRQTGCPRIQVGVSSVTVERREGVRAHRYSVAQRRAVLILVVLWLEVVVHQ